MRMLPLLSVVTIFLLNVESKQEWWQSMSLYQIYPRSFMDSDGDGVGDLNGIRAKLDYLVESRVDAFWMSPIYTSPMVDFGYDISNFVEIDPIYGSMEDFENLVKAAHNLSIKVIIDFVPNHSSDEHEWFQKSLKGIEPYTDYYVWHKGHNDNGTVKAPNNWKSAFGGSAWTWKDERKAFYLHQFAVQQPDFNFSNQKVVEEMKSVLRFWMEKGVDGFRVDAAPFFFEDDQFRDEPLSGTTSNPDSPEYMEHIYTKYLDKNYVLIREFKKTVKEYNAQNKQESRVMMVESYGNISTTMKYYLYDADFPFNFQLITQVNNSSKASDFKKVIDTWMLNMPSGATANWVAGNHDTSRLVSRFGRFRALAITTMILLLPGVSVTYYGEEIGMEDRWISWEDTIDPQGCNVGKEKYEKRSRDPERTPFQWNNSISAGFSINSTPWLPVHENYKSVNLKAEKASNDSYYNFYKTVATLKSFPVVRSGNVNTRLLDINVLAFSREDGKNDAVYVVINFAFEAKTVDLREFENVPEEINVYKSSPGSGINTDTKMKTNEIKIPPNATLIFIGIV